MSSRVSTLRARTLWRVLSLRLTLPLRLEATPLHVLLPSLTPAGCSPTRDPELEAWLERVTQGLFRHRPLRTTCLFRALVRYAVLREYGVPAYFVMGVQKGADELTGHAWVEVDGKPLFEVLSHAYVRTFEYPPQP